ncbi:Ankyrin Repeat [Phytophthora pseudosyringae]|uniref:Ankyrin Repeat n=1 Tax=Phytophthora pseudosyringae TaxID=221518 RepID=A0A8T1VKA3_9STRA|nr:Ankyrin Repeat [Phytophthora pseudosyringae]
MESPSPTLPDLCLLIKQRDVARLREVLEAHPTLIQQQRWSGVTGLHRAVSEGNVEIVQLLLSYGAQVNQRSTWGWYAPLHLACKAGSEEMIWLLLNNGGNWNLPDKAKKTPLQWAVRAGKASIAYRIDQQLHAKAKLALQQAREQQQTDKFSLTFAKLCG